jgi:hypothetical protein
MKIKLSIIRHIEEYATNGDIIMNTQIMGLRVSGTVFALMSLAQLLRLLIRPDILVAGHMMPLWPSVLAFVILGGLSFWMWSLSCCSVKE